MNPIPLFEIALALIALGLIVSFIASVKMLVAAFRTHTGWGFGIFFFFPLIIVFLMQHWEAARKPFLMGLLGTALMVGGGGLGYLGHRTGLTGGLYAIIIERLGLLENEHIDFAIALPAKPVEPEVNYVGKHVDDIIAEHGFPRVRLEAGDTIFMRFAEWEIEAHRNGIVFHAVKIDPE